MTGKSLCRGVRGFAVAMLFGAELFVANQVCAQEAGPPGVIGPMAPSAPPIDHAADMVCERLMQDYILRQVKIESTTVDAAIELVAARSKAGYWRVVYEQFQKSEINNRSFTPSGNLLKILTKILASDGRERWVAKHPELKKNRALASQIFLPPEVLDTIIERARKADQWQFDAYVFAVGIAYDPRSKPFLREVRHGRLASEAAGPGYGTANPKANLSPPTARPRIISAVARLNAAIALANLGERDELAWLIETEFADSNIHEARLRALAELTGLPRQPLENWRAWWQHNPFPDRFEPKAQANLISPDAPIYFGVPGW